MSEYTSLSSSIFPILPYRHPMKAERCAFSVVAIYWIHINEIFKICSIAIAGLMKIYKSVYSFAMWVRPVDELPKLLDNFV